MTGQHPHVRERTDMLDSLGNTTAATGKGFAIGSAALTTLALVLAVAVSSGFALYAAQAAGDAQALVDVEGIVEVRIVDQAFPADGGAGFLEIDPHDEAEIVAEAVGFLEELFSVFDGGLGIVDRAGADDGKQAVVLKMDDGVGLGAGGVDDRSDPLVDGQVIGEHRRGDERIDTGNTEVVGAVLGHGADGLPPWARLCQC